MAKTPTLKKGELLEQVSLEFLERIFTELDYTVVRTRRNNSGTQDGYDVMVEVVDNYHRSHLIYCECKDYSSTLSYVEAVVKVPQLVSTHRDIDLFLFISPHTDFSNPMEERKLDGFYETLSTACPVLFLTPEYKVSEYLSLYPNLFAKIYSQQPQRVAGQRRKELLERFGRLVFSDRRLAKLILDEGRKVEFIGKVALNPFYISRDFRAEPKENDYGWTLPDIDQPSVEHLLDNYAAVAVLGNPGLGKSHELEQLAIRLWSDRDKNRLVPIFRSLRDFHTSSSIEGLLPADFKRIGRLVLIFDGVDEVPDIMDFANKLRDFIRSNAEMMNKGRLKMIISCRTNIYLKYIKQIDDVNAFFLNGVRDGGAVKFLMDKYGLDLLDRQDMSYYRYRDVLQNPFYLELIGQNFKREGQLVLSRGKLIKAYIELRLERDEMGKFRNDADFSAEVVLIECRKLAMAMTLMQRTELKAEELPRILGGAGIVVKNPFLERNLSGTWSFEHKNLQEYFTAMNLAMLELAMILELICISGSFKVHPSWHNNVAFLVGMDLESGCQKELVDWLATNDPQLLFGADPGSVTVEVKEQVFQSIFHSLCIQQTLWIEDVSTVAGFGDTSGNVSYLLEQVANKSNNLRARISALSLMQHMAITGRALNAVETLVLDVVAEFQSDRQRLLSLLENTLKLGLRVDLPLGGKLLPRLLVELKNLDHREVVRPLLTGIGHVHLADHIAFVFSIMDKAIGVRKFRFSSKYQSIVSTKEKIFDQFSAVSDPELMLKIYRYILERNERHEFTEDYVGRFMSNLHAVLVSNVAQVRAKLIGLMVWAILAEKVKYYEDQIVADLIGACGIAEQVTDRVLAGLKSENSSPIHFLVLIIDIKMLMKIVDRYRSGKMDEKLLISFRNNLSHQDIKLSVEFQRLVEMYSEYRFEFPVVSQEAIALRNWHMESAQREFDIRFSPSKLRKQIGHIYDHYGTKLLTYSDLDGFTKIYYDDFELQRLTSRYAKQLLREMLGGGDGIKMIRLASLSRMIRLFELDRMEDIFDALPQKNRERVKVSEAQRGVIRRWCLGHVAEAKSIFKKPIKEQTDRDRRLARLLFNFQRHFKFVDMDKELLLSMVWLAAKHDGFDLAYIEGIIPKIEIEEHMVMLLADAEWTLGSRSLLLKYVYDQDLWSAVDVPFIKSEIVNELASGGYYHSMDIVRFGFSGDLPFLFQLLEQTVLDPKLAGFVGTLLDLLIKGGWSEKVGALMLRHETQILVSGVLSMSDMITFWVRINDVRAFGMVMELLKTDMAGFSDVATSYSAQWKDFTNLGALDDLFGILEICIPLKDKNGIFGDRCSPILIVCNTLGAIAEGHGEQICLLILERLKLLELIGLAPEDEAIFYINDLKNQLDALVVASRSEPYTLPGTLQLLGKYRYQLF